MIIKVQLYNICPTNARTTDRSIVKVESLYSVCTESVNCCYYKCYCYVASSGGAYCACNMHSMNALLQAASVTVTATRVSLLQQAHFELEGGTEHLTCYKPAPHSV